MLDGSSEQGGRGLAHKWYGNDILHLKVRIMGIPEGAGHSPGFREEILSQ